MYRLAFVLVLALTLASGCASNAALTETPSSPLPTEYALEYELDESPDPIQIIEQYHYQLLTSDDLNNVMAYFHEEAKMSSQRVPDNSIPPFELDKPEAIRVAIQKDMNYKIAFSLKNLDCIEDVVYFTVDGYELGGEHFIQDGYAVIKDGKIFRLHYDLPEFLE
jgi:hypothetical protein